jgi:hypothetical protein
MATRALRTPKVQGVVHGEANLQNERKVWLDLMFGHQRARTQLAQYTKASCVRTCQATSITSTEVGSDKQEKCSAPG